MVSTSNDLPYDAFLYLMRQSGVDLKPEHEQELFSYVKNVLLSLGDLGSIDVGSTEPPMMFIPAQEDAS